MPTIQPPSRNKSSIIYLLVIALFVTAFFMISNASQSTSKEISLNTFVEKVQSGNIHKLTVAGNKIDLELVDGSKLFVYKEDSANIYEILEKVNTAIFGMVVCLD